MLVHYTTAVHKIRRLIESFGYCYHFCVGPKLSYQAADTSSLVPQISQPCPMLHSSFFAEHMLESGFVTRSNFIRPTSVFDLRFQVEFEDRVLGQQKMTWVLRSTLRIKSQCRPLRPKSFSVDQKCNFCVDLINFDLNNSTRWTLQTDQLLYLNFIFFNHFRSYPMPWNQRSDHQLHSTISAFERRIEQKVWINLIAIFSLVIIKSGEKVIQV